MGAAVTPQDSTLLMTSGAYGEVGARPVGSGEPLARPGAGLVRLDLAVAGGRIRLQGGEQPVRGRRDLGDGLIERVRIGLRGLVEAGELADELQGRTRGFRPRSPAVRN